MLMRYWMKVWLWIDAFSMLTKRISMSVRHNPKHAESNPESMIGKPSDVSLAIFHQYAHLETGKTIHSSIQLEEFGLQVNEKPVWVPGGLQHIKTTDGYMHLI